MCASVEKEDLREREQYQQVQQIFLQRCLERPSSSFTLPLPSVHLTVF